MEYHGLFKFGSGYCVFGSSVEEDDEDDDFVVVEEEEVVDDDEEATIRVIVELLQLLLLLLDDDVNASHDVIGLVMIIITDNAVILNRLKRIVIFF